MCVCFSILKYSIAPTSSFGVCVYGWTSCCIFCACFWLSINVHVRNKSWLFFPSYKRSRDHQNLCTSDVQWYEKKKTEDTTNVELIRTSEQESQLCTGVKLKRNSLHSIFAKAKSVSSTMIYAVCAHTIHTGHFHVKWAKQHSLKKKDN